LTISLSAASAWQVPMKSGRLPGLASAAGGTERVSRLRHSEIEARVRELGEMTRFSGLPLPPRG